MGIQYLIVDEDMHLLGCAMTRQGCDRAYWHAIEDLGYDKAMILINKFYCRVDTPEILYLSYKDLAHDDMTIEYTTVVGNDEKDIQQLLDRVLK